MLKIPSIFNVVLGLVKNGMDNKNKFTFNANFFKVDSNEQKVCIVRVLELISTKYDEIYYKKLSTTEFKNFLEELIECSNEVIELFVNRYDKYKATDEKNEVKDFRLNSGEISKPLKEIVNDFKSKKDIKVILPYYKFIAKGPEEGFILAILFDKCLIRLTFPIENEILKMVLIKCFEDYENNIEQQFEDKRSSHDDNPIRERLTEEFNLILNRTLELNNINLKEI